MHRIDGTGATAENLFTEGDPASGVLATHLTDDWCNDVQEELATVIEAAGISLEKGAHDQLIEAITEGSLDLSWRYREMATSVTDNGDDTYTINGIIGDKTAIFHPGRKLKAQGVSTGTIFAEILTSSFSTATSVTIAKIIDATGLSATIADEALTTTVGFIGVRQSVVPWPHVDAREFGVLPGVGDVSSQLQTAIDQAVNSRIGKLVIPAGVYECHTTITIAKDIEIQGAGTHRPTGADTATVIKKVGDGDLFNMVKLGGYNLHFRDLSLEGDSEASEGRALNMVDANYQVDFSDVTIYNFPGGGVYARNLYKATFTRFVVQRCAGNGVHLDGFANSVQFFGGEISGCGTYPDSGGLLLTSDTAGAGDSSHNQNPTFIGTVLEGNDGYGAIIHSGWAQFIGCYFEGNRERGISVKDNGSVLSTRNWFRSNGLTDLRNHSNGVVSSIADVFSGNTNVCLHANVESFNAPDRVSMTVIDPYFGADVETRYQGYGGMRVQYGGLTMLPYQRGSQSIAIGEGGEEETLKLVDHDASGRLYKSFHDGERVTYLLGVSYGSAAPTAGTWTRGVIVYNQDPSPGGVLGWICTAAGTPGTWKSIGTIAS